MERKTVCLNMIVKNEAHVIRRCLDSVRPLIDSWVIVDTGSSDGTQDVIRESLKDLPGELFERPWKDFGHNRTEALQLAKGRADYLLFMDADDVADLPAGFRLPALTSDAYRVTILHSEITYVRVLMVSTARNWRYIGVMHEVIQCDGVFSRGHLDGLKVKYGGTPSGRSADGLQEKSARDAEILERALVDEPGNARYVFYLAQSYRDAGQVEKSLEAYERRATMGGFEEEVFYSLFEAARLTRKLKHGKDEVIGRFLRAYEYRPSRAEPLGELAAYLRMEGEHWPLAFLFASRAIELPVPPADVLLIDHRWYDWGCLDEYAVATFFVGEFFESQWACEKILACPTLPPEHRVRVLQNLNCALGKQGLPLVNAGA